MVDNRSVHAFIIGEHGESELAAWSNANIFGVRLSDFCEMRGHFMHEESENRIYEKVRNSAYEIIERKHATYNGIAMALKRICECIIRNEQSILPVSSMMHGIYGMKDIVISMPRHCRKGRCGERDTDLTGRGRKNAVEKISGYFNRDERNDKKRTRDRLKKQDSCSIVY